MGGALRSASLGPRSPGQDPSALTPGRPPVPAARWMAIVVVAVMAIPVVSFYSQIGAASPRSGPQSGATAQILAAERSLALGAGPAGGIPLQCAAVTAAALTCGAQPILRLTGSGANATPHWIDLTSHLNQSPAGRQLASMAYDAARGTVILFGGLAFDRGALGDTWEYSNATWVDLTSTLTPAPSPRWGAAMTFDAEQTPGAVLLFGGQNSTHFFNDTWELGTAGWVALSVGASPHPRALAYLAFDPPAQEAILYGGLQPVPGGPSTLPTNDTWSFRGGKWYNLTASFAHSPPAGSLGGLVFHSTALGLVLHGGQTVAGCSATSDTWMFTAGGWSNVSASLGGSAPPARYGLAMAFDAYDGYAIAFGGTEKGSASCAVVNETWGLTSKNWTNLTGSAGNAPSPRTGASMAYDVKDGYTVLFGGNVSTVGGVSSQSWAYSARPINFSTNHGSSGNSTAKLSAVLQATPTSGLSPLSVSFSARATGGTPPYNYRFFFGDGSTFSSSQQNVTHLYSTVGSFAATVTVFDSASNSTVATQTVAALATWQVAHQWVDLANTTPVAPQVRSEAAMVYDAALKAVVLFGGYSPSVVPFGDTWEFAQGSWTDVGATLVTAPPARWGAAMAFDARDGVVVLFGGRNLTSLFNDTWTFSASGWAQSTPRWAPSAREVPQMTYDLADGYVFLFGGETFTAPGSPIRELNDTWIFVSGAWTNISASLHGGPPPTAAGAMAYDARDGYVLMEGGTTSSSIPLTGPCSATAAVWTYSHGLWSARSSSVTPPARTGSAMVFDPADGALILFGGSISTGNGCGFDASTWSYVNGTWTDLYRVATEPPPARCCEAIAYDALDGYSLLFGGNANGVYVNDTWSYGVAPLAVTAVASPDRGGIPLNVTFAAAAAGGVLPYAYAWNFGDGVSTATGPVATHTYRVSGVFVPTLTVTDGAGRTAVRTLTIDVLSAWAAGHQWINIEQSMLVAPAPRSAAAVVYDPAVNAVLLFGGYSPYGFAYGDTWEFGNGRWTDISGSLSGSPPARWGAGIAFDPAAGYVLLFGGRAVTSLYNDTWKFTGAGWQPVSSVRAPSPRAFVQMAYDAHDGYIVLAGGGRPTASGTTLQALSDTWTFANGAWTNVTNRVGGAFPPSLDGALAYDPIDGYLVLVPGAMAGCSSAGGAYSYSSGRWQSLGLGYGPSSRAGDGVVFDSVDQSMLLYGGRIMADGCSGSNETWLYRNASWENLTGAVGPAPTPRWDAALTFDAADNVVVLFGGNANGVYLNDTWVYPASAPTVGSGTSGTGPTHPLSVMVGSSILNGTVPLQVTFSAVPSGGNSPYAFTWSFGDGSSGATGARVAHTYLNAGTYTATVLTVDAHGARLTQSLPPIHVAGQAGTYPPPPSPTLRIPFVPGSATTLAFAIGFAVGNVALIWIVVNRYRRPRRGTHATERAPARVTEKGEATSVPERVG